jgi:hypothetical protein
MSINVTLINCVNDGGAAITYLAKDNNSNSYALSIVNIQENTLDNRNVMNEMMRLLREQYYI